MDTVLFALSDANAEEVSEFSHKLVGWKVTSLNQTIPYETIFISEKPLTEIDKQRAMEVAAEVGLLAAR